MNDNEAPEFQSFPKMGRYNRGITITEKIDGTNAQLLITEDGKLFTGSRNRWITVDDDNYGFARWAYDHHAELVEGLGVGRHYGEWWGSGIQRRYGLTGGDRRFSLFNAMRWNDENAPPACCSVVPTLYTGQMLDTAINNALLSLKQYGSSAAPGFMDPEGVIVFHHAAKTSFKITIKGDDAPKSLAA